jgi:hypothetical protein
MPDLDHDRIRTLARRFRVKPGSHVRLERDHDPDDTAGLREGDAEELLRDGVELLSEYQARLAAQGTRIVKLFLNVSKAEQKERFLARIDEPDRNWKFSAGDVRERAHWDAYQDAYADVLSQTSTDDAPWFVIPADNKWFARVAAAAVIADALIDIDPRYPKLTPEEVAELQVARTELLSEDDEITTPAKTRAGADDAAAAPPASGPTKASKDGKKGKGGKGGKGTRSGGSTKGG